LLRRKAKKEGSQDWVPSRHAILQPKARGAMEKYDVGILLTWKLGGGRAGLSFVYQTGGFRREMHESDLGMSVPFRKQEVYKEGGEITKGHEKRVRMVFTRNCCAKVGR